MGVLLVVALVGCSRSPEPRQTSPGSAGAPPKPVAPADNSRAAFVDGGAESVSIEAAVAASEAALSRLDSALQLTSPDCSGAQILRERVCELADQICRLASQSVNAKNARLCEDARGRCTRAREAYSETCAD